MQPSGKHFSPNLRESKNHSYANPWRLEIIWRNIMELESFFDFISPETIRIRGTRVGIEVVLDEYLLLGHSPEAIASRYLSLDLKKVHTTIAYYLHNQEKIDAYLKSNRERAEADWREQRRNPSPVVKRLLEIKANREAEAV